MLERTKKIAFSIIELAFAFVVLSIVLAALAPIISKKVTPTAKTTTSDTSIKTLECFKEGSEYYVSEFCVACDPNSINEKTGAPTCIQCLMDEKQCSVDGKVLDKDACECTDAESET